MKDPAKWIEADLLSLVELQEEDRNREFKSCAAIDKKDDEKKTEIGRDVSAFANSDGGCIVYGVSEKKHRPHKLDDGFDPGVISKEWLEQIILSHI